MAGSHLEDGPQASKHDHGPEPSAAGWWLILTAQLVGFAVRIRGGNLHPVALAFVVIAFLVILIRPWSTFHDTQRLRRVALGFAGLQLAFFVFDAVVVAPISSGWGSRVLVAGLVTVVVALAVRILWFGDHSPLVFAAFLVLHLAFAITFLVARDAPIIDVLAFHHGAASAIAEGLDPYAVPYPDVYPPEMSSRFYGPGISVDGVLQVGYPYPPLNLVLVLAGTVLGDVRFAFTATLIAAAALIRRISPQDLGAPAAVLFLTGPAFIPVVTYGWTEPAILLALAAAVVAAITRPKITAWALGVALGLKQYMLVLAPVYALFLRRGFRPGAWLRDAFIAGGVVAATFAPFVVADPGAFWRSVVEFQFDQPYRPESLSLLAAVVNAFGWPPSEVFAVLPFAAAAVASLVVLRRGDASIRGMTQGFVLVFVAFLLVSKQAFTNYYYVVIGAALIAAACTRHAHGPAHLVATEEHAR